MRVLILAEDCNPEWPSLPVVGFKAAKAIAERADVTVATHIRNRDNIEKVGFGKARVHYIDNEYIARPLYNLARFLRGGTDVAWSTAVAMAYPSYLAFEWEVWKAFRRDLLAGSFDVVHRLTPMSPTLPSPLAKWSPVPFVLGPLNGGLKWPPAFQNELAREREWLSYIRDVYRLLPYQKSTYRGSAATLAAFRHTMADLAYSPPNITINFPEVGIDPSVFDQASPRKPKAKKTILFAGRLVPYKLPQLVVQAFGAHPGLADHRLLVAGEGPERAAIENLIQTNGWQDRIELCGWKTQAEIANLMQSADIFALTSIRELGAGVLIEAMACGLPSVVVDYGGPSELIDASRGIKVPLSPLQKLTEDFGNALAKLAADDELMVRLGDAAREHAKQFYTWDVKARKTIEVYEWATGKGERPDFWAPS
jgi:glycosyltransferase involved in cell wall biosynthesis